MDLDPPASSKGSPSSIICLEFVLSQEEYMISWALTFFIIALIAAFLGFAGIVGISMEIAWILLVVGVIVFVASFIFGRRRPVV